MTELNENDATWHT